MIRQSPPELFSQRPIRSDLSRGGGREPVINLRRLFILIGLIVLAIGVGIAVNLINRDDAPAPGEIPTIEAEMPLKERPDQPGGLDVPHQDVTVFQQLEDKGSDPVKGAIEHLLPEPETPKVEAKVEEKQAAETKTQAESVKAEVEEDLPPPITAAEPVMKTEKLIEDSKPVVEVKKPVTPPKPEPVKTVVKKAKAVKKAAPVAKVEAKVEKANPEAAKAEQAMARLPKELFTTGEVPEAKVVAQAQAPVVAASGKMRRVQLASFPEEQSAQTQVKKLQAKYAASLGGLTLQVVRADLGAKGIYYRIMSGSVDEAKAKAVCADLAKQKAACLVAR